MLTLALGRSRLRLLKTFVRGYTLLEMMVVLVIVGISVGLVSAHFMKNDDDTLQEESMRLVALMEYAADSASSSGHWLAWSLSSSGYRFLQRYEDKKIWQPITTDDVLRERQLPEGMRILSANSQQTVSASATMITLSPSGIHAPFQIELTIGKAKRVVTGNLLGQVDILNPNLAESAAL